MSQAVVPSTLSRENVTESFHEPMTMQQVLAIVNPVIESLNRG